MANIQKRSNGTWRARYRDTGGKEHARHFGRKVDAQAWLDEVTTAVRTGTYVDPARSNVTTGVVAEQWLAGKVNLKPSTYVLYESISKHVLPRGATCHSPASTTATSSRGSQPWSRRGCRPATFATSSASSPAC